MENARILELAQEQYDFLVETRRDIHRHPEPSTQELIIIKLFAPIQ